MTGIKGKKKIPSYKDASGKARIDVDNNDRKIKIGGDENIVFKETSENSCEIIIIREPYKPIDIYKTLAKMAVSIISSEEAEKIQNFLRWIRFNEKQNMYNGTHLVIERITGGQGFSPGAYSILYRKKDNDTKDSPYIVFVLYLGLIGFQIGIPYDNVEISKFTLFPIPPSKHYENIERILDFSSANIVTNEECKFSLTSML